MSFTINKKRNSKRLQFRVASSLIPSGLHKNQKESSIATVQQRSIGDNRNGAWHDITQQPYCTGFISGQLPRKSYIFKVTHFAHSSSGSRVYTFTHTPRALKHDAELLLVYRVVNQYQLYPLAIRACIDQRSVSSACLLRSSRFFRFVQARRAASAASERTSFDRHEPDIADRPSHTPFGLETVIPENAGASQPTGSIRTERLTDASGLSRSKLASAKNIVGMFR